MNLKEAFRYQNFLDRTIENVTDYLDNNQNVTKITQNHLRKKANQDAENENINTTSERKIQLSVNSIIDFLVSLMGEKEKLCNAISDAKGSCGIDIDSAIAINKWKQSINRTLATMGNIKPLERTVRGCGYKFNAEGNQVSYVYDIEEVSVIDFDRNKVKAIAKKLITESDEVSSNIDKIMVDTVVNYNSPYDVNDTLDDMLDEFVQLT